MNVDIKWIKMGWEILKWCDYGKNDDEMNM